MNRRRLILGAALFLAVETMAVLYAIWPSLFQPPRLDATEIRLGIVPTITKERSADQWRNFIEDFSKRLGCRVTPYFANSHEEAISGLMHGSLDLLYTNPAVFISLKRSLLKPWLYHKLSRRERELLRSVLVSSKPVSHITETKGFRLCLADPQSMTGAIVPMRFIESRLNRDILSWFTSVSYTNGSQSALEELTGNRADIIACDRLSLEDAVNAKLKNIESLKIIWMSQALPENLICSLQSLNPKAQERLSFLCKELSRQRVHEEFLSEQAMAFTPIDHSYSELLSSLEKYLKTNFSASESTSKTTTPPTPERL